MRVLLVILIAVSGWAGLAQFRVQQAVGTESVELRDAEVVVYVTSWCEVCQEAEAHLAKRGIAYVARDIEKDPAAYDAYRALGGNGAVPMTVIRGETLSGFNSDMMDARLYAEPDA